MIRYIVLSYNKMWRISDKTSILLTTQIFQSQTTDPVCFHQYSEPEEDATIKFCICKIISMTSFSLKLQHSLKSISALNMLSSSSLSLHSCELIFVQHLEKFLNFRNYLLMRPKPQALKKKKILISSTIQLTLFLKHFNDMICLNNDSWSCINSAIGRLFCALEGQ